MQSNSSAVNRRLAGRAAVPVPFVRLAVVMLAIVALRRERYCQYALYANDWKAALFKSTSAWITGSSRLAL